MQWPIVGGEACVLLLSALRSGPAVIRRQHVLPQVQDRPRQFDEGLARAEGYRLSSLGRGLQALSNRFWPAQFCTTIVAIAEVE